MTLIVTGNIFSGDIEIDAEIASGDFYDIAFTNNVVRGSAILKTREITKDILMERLMD